MAATMTKVEEAPPIGIDLGTTYSCFGVWQHGRVEIISNDQGNRTTLSYVAFIDTAVRFIGDAAVNQVAANPLNTVLLFTAFGWIVPAIIVSMLLGTGANAFVMALALLLAQSFLSSVLDMIWERSPDSPRAKSRSQNRKKAYPGSASGSRMREETDRNGQNGKSSDNYMSATDNVSAGKAEGRTRSFGGWDELEKKKEKGKGE